jgi:hypothetical protein
VNVENSTEMASPSSELPGEYGVDDQYPAPEPTPFSGNQVVSVPFEEDRASVSSSCCVGTRQSVNPHSEVALVAFAKPIEFVLAFNSAIVGILMAKVADV